MAERNCKKCFHYKACKEVASHSGYSDISYTESQCKHFLSKADVVEVKHGRWIRYKEDCLYNRCSRCLYEHCCEPNYCPNCGAKMDGDTDGKT